MFENFLRLTPRSIPQIIEHDYPSVRALFSEFKAAKAPVRLLLETPGYEDGSFSWKMEDRPSDPSTPYFLGSSRIGKIAHAWRLDTVGDLVDDLRLCWRWNHVLGREAFWEDSVISTPEVASKSVMAHLARTREALEKRLRYEAEHIAPFFRKLHHYCPDWTRLALYILVLFTQIMMQNSSRTSCQETDGKLSITVPAMGMRYSKSFIPPSMRAISVIVVMILMKKRRRRTKKSTSAERLVADRYGT